MDTANTLLRKINDNGRIDLQWAPGYSEPGYTDKGKGVLFANWNSQCAYVQGEGYTGVEDETMPRLARIFEHAGFEIEWSDEWSTCGDCGKAIRTSSDGYGWTQSYWLANDCEIICKDCVDPDEYFESLEGEDSHANTLFDPSEHGYVKVNGDFENGFHPGQNDNPREIGKRLKGIGVTAYVWNINGVGQFDVEFACYVREDESEQVARAEAMFKAEAKS